MSSLCPPWKSVCSGPLPIFLIGLFVFLTLSPMSSLYILGIKPLSKVSLATMFWRVEITEYLNISHNTIKVLEENIGRKISDIPRSNILTDMSPKARDLKERINKWDLIKIRSFCMAKGNISKIQRESTVWENIFANDTSDKGLISKIYKELVGLHSRKTKKNN